MLVCPNFAIGAILMMTCAAEIAKYMPRVEIIESHHDKKVDAPSGTAIKTAQVIAESNPSINKKTKLIDETEILPGARGGKKGNIPIHSVRLPGIVADQTVTFGGVGQTISLSHRTINREAFMPGVILAIRTVTQLKGLTYGLEKIL